jgi:hypothetical protein
MDNQGEESFEILSTTPAEAVGKIESLVHAAKNHCHKFSHILVATRNLRYGAFKYTI